MTRQLRTELLRVDPAIRPAPVLIVPQHVKDAVNACIWSRISGEGTLVRNDNLSMETDQ